MYAWDFLKQMDAMFFVCVLWESKKNARGLCTYVLLLQNNGGFYKGPRHQFVP
jgi:hypothetical protein